MEGGQLPQVTGSSGLGDSNPQGRFKWEMPSEGWAESKSYLCSGIISGAWSISERLPLSLPTGPFPWAGVPGTVWVQQRRPVPRAAAAHHKCSQEGGEGLPLLF